MLTPELQREVTMIEKLAPRLLWLFVVYTAVGSLFLGLTYWAVAALSFLLGVAAFALLLLSWRFYSYWLSWAIWVVPATLLTALLSKAVAGILSPVTVILVVPGFGGLGFIGTAFVLRSKVQQWFSRS